MLTVAFGVADTGGVKALFPSCDKCGLLWLGLMVSASPVHSASPLKFAFQPGQFDSSWVQIIGNAEIRVKSKYEVDYQSNNTKLDAESTFSGKLSVLLEEGNYDIRVSLGRPDAPTTTTLKAEDRRVMLAQSIVPAGGTILSTFTVNIRTPRLPLGGLVQINRRESGPPPIPRWDEKLTLECLGPAPGLKTVEITRNDEAVTLFLAGDSTVTEQHDEPYAGWGQFLPLFFPSGTAVANHAESGLALNTFRSQRRLDKILQTLKPGDYVFIQFGHNDQKEKAPGSGPFTTYSERLKEYIHEILGKQGKPVVVTPMERRRFRNGQPYATLEPFARAAIHVAHQQGVPVIDLHAMSLQVYGALGPEKSRKAFVHYPAGTFPGQDAPLKDDTYHNAYGGLQLAKCMVEGIRHSLPALAKRLRPDTPVYKPLQPDDPDSFSLPPSPVRESHQPAGN